MDKLEVMNKKGNWIIHQVHILWLVQRDKNKHPQTQTYNHWHAHPPNTSDTDGHIESKANSVLLITQK